ncbi:g7804 [Coccomyxa elongata]
MRERRFGGSCRRMSSWQKSWCALAAATSERRRSWPRRCCSRKAPIGAATTGDTRHQRWPPVQKGPPLSPRKYRHRGTPGRPSVRGAMMTERAPGRNDQVYEYHGQQRPPLLCNKVARRCQSIAPPCC